MYLKDTLLRLTAEMALLAVLAFAVGSIWNYKLLTNAWSGKSAAKAPQSVGTQVAAIPMPLGLMQVKELFDNKEAVFVDARDHNAYEAGHIKGALLLPLSDTAKALPEFSRMVPKNSALVVYCNGYACEDSIDLGKQLLAAGYATVYYFDGGFPAWRDAGYPVETRKKGN